MKRKYKIDNRPYIPFYEKYWWLPSLISGISIAISAAVIVIKLLTI